VSGRTCGVEGCDGPARARGLCWCHYTRVRNNGTTARTRPKFDQAAQAAVLAGLRKGKSLRAAALAAGWNPGSVKQMVREGRRQRPNSSLVDFARQVDGILLTTMPRSPQRFDGLSLDGRLFLEALERQTDRSLQRDPTRWPWRRSDQLPPWGVRHPDGQGAAFAETDRHVAMPATLAGLGGLVQLDALVKVLAS
jgi:hypothetical protein